MSSSQIECPAYEAYLRMMAPVNKKYNDKMQSFLSEVRPKAIEKIEYAIEKGKEKDEIIIHESKVDGFDLDPDSDDFEKIPMSSLIYSMQGEIIESLTFSLQEAFQEYGVTVVIDTRYIYSEYDTYLYEADIISVYIIPKSF
jgi:hypothetical protein